MGAPGNNTMASRSDEELAEDKRKREHKKASLETIRVSTDGQDLTAQTEALQVPGVAPEFRAHFWGLQSRYEKYRSRRKAGRHS
jgi:hypothetical protein